MMTRASRIRWSLAPASMMLITGCAGVLHRNAAMSSETPAPSAARDQSPGDLPPQAASASDRYVSLEETLAVPGETPSNPSLPDRADTGRSSFDPWLGLYGEVDGYSGRSAQTSAVENITQVTFATEGRDAEPDVDKTGALVVYSSTQHSRASDLFVKSISGQTMQRLTDDPANDRMPRFSPDNSQIAFCSNRTGDYDIYLIDANGGQAVQVTADPAHEIHPSWSPDGKYLVYSRLGDQSGRWEMWVTETGNFNTRRFIGYGLCPEWNPDPASNLIAYQSPRERGSRRFSIWTIEYVNGEGTRPTEIASALNAAAINPSWSPDGRRLTFTTVLDPGHAGEAANPERETWADIWVVNLDGSQKVNLTNGQYTNVEPTWSPDGRILFVSNRAGIDNIWSIGPDRAMETAKGPAMTNPNTGVAEVGTNP